MITSWMIAEAERRFSRSSLRPRRWVRAMRGVYRENKSKWDRAATMMMTYSLHEIGISCSSRLVRDTIIGRVISIASRDTCM